MIKLSFTLSFLLILCFFTPIVFSLTTLDVGLNDPNAIKVVLDTDVEIYGLLSGDNLWTGLNTFLNVTIINESYLNVNGTVNASAFCLNGVCYSNWSNVANTSGYVPYVGAVADVDLGINNLSVGQVNLSGDFGMFKYSTNATMFLNSAINKDSCIHLTEGIGSLGTVICNDGSGVNRFVISNQDTKQEYLIIDRDSGVITFNNATVFNDIVNFTQVNVSGNITVDRIFTNSYGSTIGNGSNQYWSVEGATVGALGEYAILTAHSDGTLPNIGGMANSLILYDYWDTTTMSLIFANNLGTNIATMSFDDGNDWFNFNHKVRVEGDLEITGNLILTAPLPIASGGTGASTYTDGYLPYYYASGGYLSDSNIKNVIDYGIVLGEGSGGNINTTGIINASSLCIKGDCEVDMNNLQLNNSRYVNFSSMTLGTARVVTGDGSLNMSGNITVGSSVLIVGAGNRAQIGVNTLNPLLQLHVVSEAAGLGGSLTRGMGVTQSNNGAGGPAYTFMKSRGTYAVPTIVVNGDSVGQIASRGYNGTGYMSTSLLSFFVNGTVTADYIPVDLVFLSNGSYISAALDSNERFRISGSTGNVRIGSPNGANQGAVNRLLVIGDVNITSNMTVNNTLYVLSNGNVGIGTSAPNQKLEVNGSINATGNVYFNVTDEIVMDVSRFRLPGINPPEEAVVGLFPVLNFDKNTNESIYGAMHVIPQYRPGSSWQVAFYWAPSDTSVGNVSWCVEVVRLNHSSTYTLTDAGTVFCTTALSSGVTDNFLKSTKINISGVDTVEDQEFGFRVHRGADLPVNDTYDADARLVEVDIYYNAYRVGE